MEKQTVGQKIWTWVAIACLVLVSFVILSPVFFGITAAIKYYKLTPEQKAGREALVQTQAHLRELKLLDYSRILFQMEGVVYREAQPIGTTGLSLIVVECASNHHLFNIVVSTSTKLKKGDPVMYSTLSYNQSGWSGATMNVLR